MYKIGITGSIGTGKTTTANLAGFLTYQYLMQIKKLRLCLTKKLRKKKKRWPEIVVEIQSQKKIKIDYIFK